MSQCELTDEVENKAKICVSFVVIQNESNRPMAERPE